MNDGLLSEGKGTTSSARVNMFLCTIGALFLGGLGIWKGLDPLSLAVLCGVFVGVGTGGKVAQKGKEGGNS